MRRPLRVAAGELARTRCVSSSPTSKAPDRPVGHARRVDLSAGRRAGLSRDRRLRGPDRSRRDGDRARRRRGVLRPRLVAARDRDRVGVRRSSAISASFWLGRRLGPEIRATRQLVAPGARVGAGRGVLPAPRREGDLRRALIGLVRAVSPFLAGARALAAGFVPWSLLGTLVWVTAFTLLGYGRRGVLVGDPRGHLRRVRPGGRARRARRPSPWRAIAAAPRSSGTPDRRSRSLTAHRGSPRLARPPSLAGCPDSH